MEPEPGSPLSRDARPRPLLSLAGGPPDALPPALDRRAGRPGRPRPAVTRPITGGTCANVCGQPSPPRRADAATCSSSRRPWPSSSRWAGPRCRSTRLTIDSSAPTVVGRAARGLVSCRSSGSRSLAVRRSPRAERESALRETRRRAVFRALIEGLPAVSYTLGPVDARDTSTSARRWSSSSASLRSATRDDWVGDDAPRRPGAGPGVVGGRRRRRDAVHGRVPHHPARRQARLDPRRGELRRLRREWSARPCRKG